MREALLDFDSPAKLVLVTFTDPASAESYATQHDLSFPVLLDADRSVFTAYGLGRGAIRDVYGWRTLRRYWQVFRSTGLGDFHKATEDTLQLGGDFVIAPNGDLAYGYWSKGPADRPAITDIVNHLG